MGKTQVKSRIEMSTKVGVAVAVVMLAAALATVGPKVMANFAAGAVTASTCKEFPLVDVSETSNREVPSNILALNPKYFNPHVASMAKGGGSSYSDRCLIDVYQGLSSTGKHMWQSTATACLPSDEDGVTKRNCRLQEGYCANGKVSNYTFKCPNGCRGGKCIPVGFSLDSTNVYVESGASSNDDMGIFTIRFKVKASGSPIYVSTLADIRSTGNTFGKTTVIIEKNGVAVATTTGASVTLTNITSGLVTPVGNYKIADGSEALFELTTSIQLPAIGTTGQYRVRLGGVMWALVDEKPINSIIGNIDNYKTSYRALN